MKMPENDIMIHGRLETSVEIIPEFLLEEKP
jgi:hypothetical protein